LQNPTDRIVVEGLGYSELFEVSVVSSDPVVYKWQQSVDGGNTYFDINPNGGVFSGANSPTLGINAGMTDLSSTWNGAKFRCVIQSGDETIISEPGTLTVVRCESSCSALGEVLDQECVCTCECPEGEVNTGVAFAPNGELVCECLFSSLWVRVKTLETSSSSEGSGLGIMSEADEYCIRLSELDPTIHAVIAKIGQELFLSEGDCIADGSSSSSSIFEELFESFAITDHEQNIILSENDDKINYERI
jgi:hypothetical protein